MKKKTAFILTLAIAILLIGSVCVSAKDVESRKTGISLEVEAIGQYANWDGISNISQFTDSSGNYCFAYDNDTTVIVVKTFKGEITEKIKLKKKHSIFGCVDCDSDGYFYLVTGEDNNGDNTDAETIFVSQYSSDGQHIKTVGDDGSSSLAYYYDSSFYTKKPLSHGNCDIAINGDYIAINYARSMYNGHQSNSVWILKRSSLTTVSPDTPIYNSHSFGQRAIAFGTGFLFMSEGDCYPRAFTVNYESMTKDGVTSNTADIFHFWVKKGTLDAGDMGTLNRNYATIGDLCDLGNGTASFVASSVKAMNSKADSQTHQIFIQIFNPKENMNKSSAYTIAGKRSGQSGPNGDEKQTDYGIKWLTNYTKKSGKTIDNVQAVADNKGNTIILFEQYKNNKYKGIFYCVVDNKGNLTTKITKCSSTGRLNPCETPVYSDGKVWWTGNSSKSENRLFIYSLKV
jgi:hypothetical protein